MHHQINNRNNETVQESGSQQSAQNNFCHGTLYFITGQVLILDEPFNFLDPSSQSIIKQLLKKYNEEHKATVIISSHNLNHTVDVCPRIALLEHGVIIRDIQNENNSAEKELEAYFNVSVEENIEAETNTEEETLTEE